MVAMISCFHPFGAALIEVI
jgi:hypothetical protein